MNTIYNTELYFSSHSNGLFVNPPGNPSSHTYYSSWDSVVLYGSAVTLGDQQHEDNNGVNYLSYRVKRVRLRGNLNLRDTNIRDGYNSRFYIVLYKVSSKYENGMVVPCATTKNFTQFKDYILYSNPQSVLVWHVYGDERNNLDRIDVNFSLSCDKTFVLGPCDLLCCNVLAVFARINASLQTTAKPVIVSRVVFDIN